MILDNFKKQQEEAAMQEAAIHEQYLVDLLEKHKLLPTRTDMASAISQTGMAMIHEHMEKLGYYLEHRVHKTKDGSELHSYRLFKLYDTSPDYKIKRVISVEEDRNKEP